MDATRPLPDFADPPVAEVALAVQFEPLADLRTPQIGLLWNKFRDRFPQFEEHPLLDPIMERFGVKQPPRASVQFEMVRKPPVQRCWFLNKSGTELVQVQQDRFAHNWRKVGDGDEYPRYEHVRDTFKNELGAFERFLGTEKVGDLMPNQCEVTYVNHIVADEGWKNHGELAQVLTLFGGKCSEEFLPDLEEARVSGSYVIPGDGGQPPLGRLRFSIDPVYLRESGQPMFLLNLVARGRPDGEGVDGVLRFLDTAREWIVRGFAAITTPNMHEVWGRCDDH